MFHIKLTKRVALAVAVICIALGVSVAPQTASVAHAASCPSSGCNGASSSYCNSDQYVLSTGQSGTPNPYETLNAVLYRSPSCATIWTYAFFSNITGPLYIGAATFPASTGSGPSSPLRQANSVATTMWSCPSNSYPNNGQGFDGTDGGTIRDFAPTGDATC